MDTSANTYKYGRGVNSLLALPKSQVTEKDFSTGLGDFASVCVVGRKKRGKRYGIR